MRRHRQLLLLQQQVVVVCSSTGNPTCFNQACTHQKQQRDNACQVPHGI
jgi:hypothetical protein